MITRHLQSLFLAVGAATMAATVAPAAGPPPLALDWATVVNNNDQMPGAPPGRTFNNYNQPVNPSVPPHSINISTLGSTTTTTG